ncbi:MAG: tRNA (N6-isopentenyl adenosine(37)-C2)-methylthiotransferase MiaB [Gemmiger sp.]|nr:tRNA (N6-isopentenyl adenosine(37)-C2)-methylthiotransferase MiaB [Gemmiger sp.]
MELEKKNTSYQHNETAAATIAAHYDTPPLAYVRSYGCQQNVNDGEKLRGVLLDTGFGICDTPDEADLILFNTCAVREHAEQRVFGNVGALKKLKEQNPRLMIGVCGCMAQQQSVVDKLRASYPYVDLVFGVDGIDRLPAMLAERLQKGKRYLENPRQRDAVVEQVPIRRDSGFRAWLPIMYGCDNFCTYCIVPYVRGRERSRRPADVLAEFRQLVESGYKEITLLGQNVNSYGKGLTGADAGDFADLLNLLCTQPGDYQIRFMTSHPKDASHKLIDTIAAQPKLCKHIHLPVQSGSDDMLQKMNRHYNVAQYLELVEYARAKIPGVTFSSDIIVGFPGESEEDFEKTLALIKQVGYMQLFTFIYSKRGGTKAAELPDPTTHAEKAARMERLLRTQDDIAFPMIAALAGSRVRVLAEAAGRAAGTLNGRLDNNLVVEFPGEESLVGQYLEVELTGSRAALLLGRQTGE